MLLMHAKTRWFIDSTAIPAQNREPLSPAVARLPSPEIYQPSG
jgi:hypothetical protein